MTRELKSDVLLGLFIAAVLASNLLGGKVTTLFGINTSVAIFFFPLTFLITDVVSEVFGKKKSTYFIYAGLSSIILVLLFTLLARALPSASFYKFSEEYNVVFKNSIRIMIASLVAFLLGQFHDIWAFHFLKKKTHNKFLWLRNNLSTIGSQLIDTTIFTFIAFYHISPEFDGGKIISLIIPYWLLKVIFALLDTPFVYLGVQWFKKENVQS